MTIPEFKELRDTISLIPRAINAINCMPGSVCYRQKHSGILQNNLNNAQAKLANAPLDLAALERNKQLLVLRGKENQTLIKNINVLDRMVKTNERKVVYEDNDTEGLYTYRRVLLFLYYSAIVIYIIFSNFIPDKLYLKYSVWIIIIIVSIIPIILNMLMKWVFVIGDVIYYWFKEIPHKDVYIDL